MILLHVGFHKSATTTLQFALFRNHAGANLVGKPYASVVLRDAAWSIFQGSAEHDIALVNYVHSLIDRDPHKTVILSEEEFTGPRTNVMTTAAHLHELWPDAHILFTIRNQTDALLSFYAATNRPETSPFALTSGPLTLAEWFDRALDLMPGGPLGAFDYWSTIEIYLSLFGRDHVNVLLFEDFRDDLRTFSARISSIAGLDPSETTRLLEGQHYNPAPGSRLDRYYSFRSKFFPSTQFSRLFPAAARIRAAIFHRIGPRPQLKDELPPQIASRINDLYAAGNRRLQSELALDLETRAYPGAA